MNYKLIISIFTVIGMVVAGIGYFDYRFASAESMKDVIQSIQKTNEKLDLEIIALKCEFTKKQIKELERECSRGCSIDKMQELTDLKEQREDLRKKMERK